VSKQLILLALLPKRVSEMSAAELDSVVARLFEATAQRWCTDRRSDTPQNPRQHSRDV
jgi:hypothetical protein